MVYFILHVTIDVNVCAAFLTCGIQMVHCHDDICLPNPTHELASGLRLLLHDPHILQSR